MADVVIGIPKLYGDLKLRAEARIAASQYSMQDTIVRLREGIKNPHAGIVMCLYWWHLFLSDRPLYERLKAASDEGCMRQILGGKVMSAYVQGEKTITICSDLFPPEFFEIIDAYIAYTDDLSR